MKPRSGRLRRRPDSTRIWLKSPISASRWSWIHKDKDRRHRKSDYIGETAIAKLNLNKPLIAGESAVTKRALVIGGGIAGIQTALDIAEAGYEVDIVEKSPTIGGKMAQLDKTFPTLDCAALYFNPENGGRRCKRQNQFVYIQRSGKRFRICWGILR